MKWSCSKQQIRRESRADEPRFFSPSKVPLKVVATHNKCDRNWKEKRQMWQEKEKKRQKWWRRKTRRRRRRRRRNMVVVVVVSMGSRWNQNVVSLTMTMTMTIADWLLVPLWKKDHQCKGIMMSNCFELDFAVIHWHFSASERGCCVGARIRVGCEDQEKNLETGSQERSFIAVSCW